MDGSHEPSSLELLLLTLCACAVLAACIELSDPHLHFWDFGAGDTPTYAALTTGLRTGNAADLRGPKNLWGIAYLAAGTAILTQLPDVIALLVVSMSASLVSVVLRSEE